MCRICNDENESVNLLFKAISLLNLYKSYVAGYRNPLFSRLIYSKTAF